MKKYWALVKNYFVSAMIKKADFFGQIIINLVQISATVILWISIYNPNQTFNGYTLQDTILYYVLVLLITYATTTTTADYIARNIKSGTISEWLLKPRNILLTELSRAFGDQIFRVIVLVPIYILLGVFVTLINIGIHFTIEGILLGILFVMLGFLINCLFEYFLSLFAFWLDEVWSIKHFKEVTADLLGGKRIPLAFFPPIISSINNVLPFKFIYFIPLEYFLNKRTLGEDFTIDIITALAWIIVFYVISSITFKIGIKKYGAFGN